jgi:predicted ribosome quality control (RQC) complex YloA/Tae2 family protein
MVFFFTSSDGHLLYMGKDKYENESLIKYGFSEDVWFHVDDMSSAHVYVRLNECEKWDQMPELLLLEVC